MIGRFLVGFSLRKLFVFGCLVESSAVAAPAGHALGDIVALANPKFFAQALVDQLGHVFWKPELEIAQLRVGCSPEAVSPDCTFDYALFLAKLEFDFSFGQPNKCFEGFSIGCFTPDIDFLAGFCFWCAKNHEIGGMVDIGGVDPNF